MAAKVEIISQKNYKQWLNGSDFSLNTSDYTNNLVGNVMQKIKTVTTVVVANYLHTEADSRANLQWDLAPEFPNSDTTVTIAANDGTNFYNEGFRVGDNVDVYFISVVHGAIPLIGRPVTYCVGNTIKFTMPTPASFPTDINQIQLYNSTEITSLIYNFGLTENGNNYTNLSLVSNESQSFYTLTEIGAGSPRSTAFVDCESMGTPKSWVSGNGVRVRYVSGTSSQVFEIEHTYILPFFTIQDSIDFFDGLAPDYLAGSNSLKYCFEADFRTSLYDPNTSRKTKISNELGSVGFFNETFNGFNSNYALNSVTYTDSLLNSSDGILIGGTTIITIEVEKISGNFGTDNVGLYFSYLPEIQSETENTLTNFEDNFIYDNIFAEIGAVATTGLNVIKSCQTTAVGNILTIVAETSFTTAQQLKISGGKRYVIGIEVGDSTLTSNISDIVILKEVNYFDESTDIPNLISNFNMAIYPHTEYFSGGGFTDFKGWIEDGLALNGSFEIDLGLEAIINSFKVYLIAHNSTQNIYFILDQFNIPLGSIGSVTALGYTYQIINTNTTRGYQLVGGSEKNGVSLVLDAGSVGTSTPLYNFTFAQKIKWQDWLKNTNVNNIFYNLLKPQNNLNFKSSNYSAVFGYQIQMMFEVNMSGVSPLGLSGATDYRFFTPNLRIYDYDLDSYTTPRFTQIIETFHPTTLANLGGAILVGEDTLFKTTWTDTFGAITDITDFWGIHRIEESGGVGNIYELSSYEANELTNNLLKPISGNYLTKTLTAGKLVTTCYIDGTKLTNGVNYDISSRIDGPKNQKPRLIAKTLSDGTIKTLNNGTHKSLIL